MALSDEHVLGLLRAHNARSEPISPMHSELSEADTFESFPPGLSSTENVASQDAPTSGDNRAELAEAYRQRDEALQTLALLQARCDEQEAKLEEAASVNKRHVVATEKLRANVEYWQKRWVIQADWAKDARVAVMKREQGKGVRFAVDGSPAASLHSSPVSPKLQRNGSSQKTISNGINGSLNVPTNGTSSTVKTVVNGSDTSMLQINGNGNPAKPPSLKSNSSSFMPASSAIVSAPAQIAKSHLADEIPLDPHTIFISYEHARRFLEFYSRSFDYGLPQVTFQLIGSDWEATMTVGGPSIGFGCSIVKECAMIHSFLDAARYLEKCDPELVESFNEHISKGPASDASTPSLTNELALKYALALRFMEYYCLRFEYDAPNMSYLALCAHEWEATMSVGGRRLGMGTSHNTSDARVHCYVDVFEYLRNIDPPLWRTFADLDGLDRPMNQNGELVNGNGSVIHHE